MKPSLTLVAVVGGAALFAALVWFPGGRVLGTIREAAWGPEGAPITVVVPAAALTETASRTVVVTEPGKPTQSPLVLARQCGSTPYCHNGAGGIDVVALLAGVPPTTTMTAVVLTDTNCMPDGAGISHCVNTLRLADGGLLTVRHDHNMRLYPCLTSGETVRLVGLAAT